MILVTGFVVLFFTGGSRYAFGLMLKPMSEDLDVSRSTLSLAVTTFMVVSALALPFMGRLVDQWSMKGTIGIAAVIGGAGIGLMGQVQAPWHVFIVYGVVFGIGNCPNSARLSVSQFLIPPGMLRVPVSSDRNCKINQILHTLDNMLKSKAEISRIFHSCQKTHIDSSQCKT